MAAPVAAAAAAAADGDNEEEEEEETLYPGRLRRLHPSGTWGFVHSEYHIRDLFLDLPEGDSSLSVGDFVVFSVDTDENAFQTAVNARQISDPTVFDRVLNRLGITCRSTGHFPIVDLEVTKGVREPENAGEQALRANGNAAAQEGAHQPQGQSFDNNANWPPPPPIMPAPPVHPAPVGPGAFQQNRRGDMPNYAVPSYAFPGYAAHGDAGPTYTTNVIISQGGSVMSTGSTGLNAGGTAGDRVPVASTGLSYTPATSTGPTMLLEPPPLLDAKLMVQVLLAKQALPMWATSFRSPEGMPTRIGKEWCEMLKQACNVSLQPPIEARRADQHQMYGTMQALAQHHQAGHQRQQEAMGDDPRQHVQHSNWEWGGGSWNEQASWSGNQVMSAHGVTATNGARYVGQTMPGMHGHSTSDMFYGQPAQSKI
jgi:hypothetical protein